MVGQIRTAVRIYRYFRHLVYGQWDFGVLRTQGIASLQKNFFKSYPLAPSPQPVACPQNFGGGGHFN